MVRTAVVTTLLTFVAAIVVGIGVLAYHADAASRAQAAPTDTVVTTAFGEAAKSWLGHMDGPPVHRLVLTSAEEYGGGVYLFVFDIYYWFGIGSGYAAHSTDALATGCGGGGLVRTGGLVGIGEISSGDGLSETRESCTRTYGPGRVVAPRAR